MSHHLLLEDIKNGQIVLIALSRDEGYFLNQNFPKIPKDCFWIGGVFTQKDKNTICVEVKPFKNLSTIDIDCMVNGNFLNIPVSNIDNVCWFCGTAWIFLKS